MLPSLSTCFRFPMAPAVLLLMAIVVAHGSDAPVAIAYPSALSATAAAQFDKTFKRQLGKYGVAIDSASAAEFSSEMARLADDAALLAKMTHATAPFARTMAYVHRRNLSGAKHPFSYPSASLAQIRASISECISYRLASFTDDMPLRMRLRMELEAAATAAIAVLPSQLERLRSDRSFPGCSRILSRAEFEDSVLPDIATLLMSSLRFPPATPPVEARSEFTDKIRAQHIAECLVSAKASILRDTLALMTMEETSNDLSNAFADRWEGLTTNQSPPGCIWPTIPLISSQREDP